MWVRFAVNKSNYQGRYPRPSFPGRSQFPVPVQSFASPSVPARRAEEEGLVAKGVMETGSRGKETVRTQVAKYIRHAF
jgi:hypothetical protein